MSDKRIIISLNTGDVGDDGHGKYDSTYILSNLSHTELQQAYNQGSSQLGIDITLYCKEYVDNTFPKDDYDKLIQSGYDHHDDNLWEDNNIYYMEIKVFIKLWLFIAGIGNTSFEYKYLECDNTLDIGGYGLY